MPKASPPDASQTMRAIVYDKHGDVSVLRFEANYPQPVLLDHQVKIQIHAASLNPADFKYRRQRVPNFVVPKPKITGHDVAGIVLEVGKRVSNKFHVGDRVCAMLPGLFERWGALADVVAVDHSLVAHVGPQTGLLDAAAMPMVSLTALCAFEKLDPSNIGPGKRILIHAGAGGVGTFAIQYAKNVLKMHVAVTASAAKADRLRALGSDEVIDYRTVRFETVAKDYDVVLDPMSWSYEQRTLQSKNVLKPSGHYLNIMSSDWSVGNNGKASSVGGTSFWNCFKSTVVNWFRANYMPKYSIVVAQPNSALLQQALEWLEQGTVRVVVDRTFSLEDAVAAFTYLEQGHATGKVMISINNNNNHLPPERKSSRGLERKF